MNKLWMAAIAVLALTTSCKKKTDVIDEYATTDTTGSLKQAISIPMGVGARLDLYKTDPAYAAIIKNEFNAITFSNELKNEAIISNEGIYDYSKVDEFVGLAESAGLDIFGHALVGYNMNNLAYMRSLTQPTSEENAVINNSFESGTATTFTNWVTQVDPSANAQFAVDGGGTAHGSRALKVTVTTPGTHQYSVQAYNENFILTPGYSYTLSFYAKAAANGARFKAVIQNGTYQERTFTLTTGWQKYSWTFTARETYQNIRLHFPFAGTFWFDEFTVPRSVSGVYTIDPAKVDSAMKKFITTTVSRYKNKVNAWDVVNEPFDDATGAIKTNPLPGSVTSSNFYWAEYLGESYIEKALQYAHQADPNALLFINEDKLESDDAKVNAMVNLVNKLKGKGVPVHGIGVQMHITVKNDRAAIDRAFQKLAATGLKIRISEMDVRVNPWNEAGFKATSDLLTQQRDLYRYAIGSYLRHVPPPQRHGITVWNVTDKDSWIVTTQGKEDAPTLFVGNYTKKPAYYGVMVGLKNGNK